MQLAILDRPQLFSKLLGHYSVRDSISTCNLEKGEPSMDPRSLELKQAASSADLARGTSRGSVNLDLTLTRSHFRHCTPRSTPFRVGAHPEFPPRFSRSGVEICCSERIKTRTAQSDSLSKTAFGVKCSGNNARLASLQVVGLLAEDLWLWGQRRATPSGVWKWSSAWQKPVGSRTTRSSSHLSHSLFWHNDFCV